ncbi:hypothetical protein [Nonomuraea basaltis]|nr:hypothetical protein [Nonomuraea basaltis]
MGAAQPRALDHLDRPPAGGQPGTLSNHIPDLNELRLGRASALETGGR